MTPELAITPEGCALTGPVTLEHAQALHAQWLRLPSRPTTLDCQGVTRFDTALLMLAVRWQAQSPSPIRFRNLPKGFDKLAALTGADQALDLETNHG